MLDAAVRKDPALIVKLAFNRMPSVLACRHSQRVMGRLMPNVNSGRVKSRLFLQRVMGRVMPTADSGGVKSRLFLQTSVTEDQFADHLEMWYRYRMLIDLYFVIVI